MSINVLWIEIDDSFELRRRQVRPVFFQILGCLLAVQLDLLPRVRLRLTKADGQRSKKKDQSVQRYFGYFHVRIVRRTCDVWAAVAKKEDGKIPPSSAC